MRPSVAEYPAAAVEVHHDGQGFIRVRRAYDPHMDHTTIGADGQCYVLDLCVRLADRTGLQVQECRPRLARRSGIELRHRSTRRRAVDEALGDWLEPAHSWHCGLFVKKAMGVACSRRAPE